MFSVLKVVYAHRYKSILFAKILIYFLNKWF